MANSIDEKLQYLSDTKEMIRQAISGKGQLMPTDLPFREYVDKINNISVGIDTSDADATTSDIADDKTAYVNGKKITGSLADYPKNNSISGGIVTDEADIKNITIWNKNSDTDLLFDKILRGGAGLRASYSNVADAIGLTADKILKGNTILGIEGTAESSENLQEQLDAQDTIIKELQASLDNKASSTDIKPNIFMQETEPVKKEGIWFKSNKPVDHIIMDTNIIEGGNWDTINEYPDLPYNFGYYCKACTIDNIIYLFDEANKKVYKFDTNDLSCTEITDVDFDFKDIISGCYFCAVNKYIYAIYTSRYGDTSVYQFDTVNNTCKRVFSETTNILSYSSEYISAVGTDIYIFDANSKICKFDTLTNKLTLLNTANIKGDCYNVCCTTIGTDIFIFGGYTSSQRQKAYKFDTTSNEYIELADMPYGGYSLGITSVGNDIYLFGLNDTLIYKYNIVDNTYTSVGEVSDMINSSYAVNINDNKIFVLGGTNTSRKIRVYVLNNKDYDNNSIIVWSGNNKYMTQLYTSDNIVGRLLFGFYKAYYYTTANKLDASLPLYYGNGKEWIKISGGEG